MFIAFGHSVHIVFDSVGTTHLLGGGELVQLVNAWGNYPGDRGMNPSNCLSYHAYMVWEVKDSLSW